MAKLSLIRRLAPLGVLVAATTATPAQAGAFSGNIAVPALALPSITFVVQGIQPMSAQQDCVAPLAANAQVPAQVPAMSKSAAILGGQMSALDRIRAQQTGEISTMPVEEPVVAATPAVAAPCAGQGTVPGFAVPQPVAGNDYGARSGEILGSMKLPIRRTKFDADWARVSSRGLSSRDMRRSIGTTELAGMEGLQRVNAWVNTNIAHQSDRAATGKADSWADARSTLRSKNGDCEDFAILKMQMLASLGYSREDMTLTLARDLVRGADHAVLIVREGGQYWMLDNATNTVLPAHRSYDYRPVMSFGEGKTWLHGYAMPAKRLDYRSVMAVSSARRTGLNR